MSANITLQNISHNALLNSNLLLDSTLDSTLRASAVTARQAIVSAAESVLSDTNPQSVTISAVTETQTPQETGYIVTLIISYILERTSFRNPSALSSTVVTQFTTSVSNGNLLSKIAASNVKTLTGVQVSDSVSVSAPVVVYLVTSTPSASPNHSPTLRASTLTPTFTSGRLINLSDSKCRNNDLTCHHSDVISATR